MLAREWRVKMRQRPQRQLHHLPRAQQAAGGGLDPAKTPHAGRVAIPTAKPGANTPRGSVGDLVATLEETKQLLGDRDEQLRKARTREAELMTALESERQCVLRAERRVGVLERALGVAGPQGVFPVPADVHQEIDEMESSATNLEASFGAYLDEKSVTEHEHGAGTVMDPMDMVARAEAAVRGAIEETARASAQKPARMRRSGPCQRRRRRLRWRRRFVLLVDARMNSLLGYPRLNAIEPRG